MELDLLYEGAHRRSRPVLRALVDHPRTEGSSVRSGCATIGLPWSTYDRRPRETTADVDGPDAIMRAATGAVRKGLFCPWLSSGDRRPAAVWRGGQLRARPPACAGLPGVAPSAATSMDGRRTRCDHRPAALTSPIAESFMKSFKHGAVHPRPYCTVADAIEHLPPSWKRITTDGVCTLPRGTTLRQRSKLALLLLPRGATPQTFPVRLRGHFTPRSKSWWSRPRTRVRGVRFLRPTRRPAPIGADPPDAPVPRRP